MDGRIVISYKMIAKVFWNCTGEVFDMKILEDKEVMVDYRIKPIALDWDDDDGPIIVSALIYLQVYLKVLTSTFDVYCPSLQFHKYCSEISPKIQAFCDRGSLFD